MKIRRIFKTDKELEDQMSDEILVARVPVLLWVSLVYVASMILQMLGKLNWMNTLIFTAVYVIHLILHWNLFRVVKTKAWIYFLIQGLLVFTCALLMPDSSPAVLIGLFPVLIGQSISLYYQKRKIALVIIYSFIMFFYAILYLGNRYELVLMVPLFLLMLIVVVAYASLFFRQVHARIRTQTFLRDLEKAHKKVEELTLVNERQRLARDLHDTLAQGLAGIIMHIEAIDAHVSKGNITKAQEYLKISMGEARRILAEARLAIDNLRVKSASNVEFEEAVNDEIRRFIQATGISILSRIEVTSHMSGTLKEHSLQIISECLMNVAKHAKADTVWVNVSERSSTLYTEIRDNGVGFDTNLIGQKTGHYGILGMYERVRLIGGTLTIHSHPTGTRIQIEAPIQKGEGI